MSAFDSPKPLPLSVLGPNSASQLSIDLRPRLRLSTPANQRFDSVAPNRRRSLSRRSAFLRNLHEHFAGIVQAGSGRRGASRSRKGLPVARIAAAQRVLLGAISTVRKSPVLLGRFSLAIGLGLSAGCSREILPSSPFSSSITTACR
jgi:hypothetical protein